jgi:hypothetical protein
MAVFISISAGVLQGETDNSVVPGLPSTAPTISSTDVDSEAKSEVFGINDETLPDIAGDWSLTLTGTSCFQGTCWDIGPWEAVYHFTQSGETFRGTVNFQDGSSSVYEGRFINDTDVDGQWHLPTTLGGECGAASGSGAQGTFTGRIDNGRMDLSLDGTWPHHNLESCTFAGNGIFTGNVVSGPSPGQPNLQPTEITFSPSTAGVGDTVFFDSGIRNTGDVDSDVFAIKWFVNNQEVGAYGGHAGVPAGQTIMDGNSQFSWTFNSTGTYSVTFTVDVDNHIEESNEEDNSTTIDVVIGQSPEPQPTLSGVQGVVLGVDSGANDGSSTLLQISSETAAGTAIGETGFILTDVAVTPDGRVFGILPSRLFSINLTTGIASPVGTGLGVSDANALVSDANGVLYGATSSGWLIRIDPQTGHATAIGVYGSGYTSSGDLAFSPNGQLFGTVLDGGTDEVLISVDVATGLGTMIGRVGFPNVFGLAFTPDGTLFGATSGNPPSLLVIDTTTGAGTAIGTISNANGITGLTYSLVSRIPQGKAPNLVVLVHGCCTDANDISNVWDSFGSLIAGTIQTPEAWEVVVLDWTKHTPKTQLSGH